MPVSKLILSLGSRPDTHEHSHSGRRGRELPVSKLIHREALRRALALQPSVGRPKQLHPGFGHLSRHPSPQPHAILGEGPSSIVSTHRIQSGIRKCCIFGFSAVFFPRRFTKPSRCERGARRSGGKQRRLAPDLKSRSGTSQSNVANWVKQFQTHSHAPSSRREEPTGGGHAIVVPDRSVPRLSPPDSGTLPRLHGLYNLPPPVACTWRRRHRGEGPRGGNASPQNR